jgi:phage tail sheath protein FI
MVAVLGLPAHYREAEARTHARELRRFGAEPGPAQVRALDYSEERLLSFGTLYHPWLVMAAEGPTRTVTLAPDGVVCGSIAARTIAAGAWQAPANAPLPGVVALGLAVELPGWAELLDARVNLVRRDPRGFMLLSADTLSLDPELRPINVRRLLILLRRLALREGANYVFQSNNEPFQRQVRRGFEQVLADLFRRGAFAGRTAAEAYQVGIDPTLNTSASIEQGRLIIELRVAPSRPLVFITVRLQQTGADGVSAQEL